MDREQAWLDTLKGDSLTVAQRVMTMPHSMASAFIAVQVAEHIENHNNGTGNELKGRVVVMAATVGSAFAVGLVQGAQALIR